MKKIKVAVYGTLRRGNTNHDVLGNEAVLLGYDRLDGYVMYNLGMYPAAVVGQGKILVEVYEVPQQQLHRLDRLEGYSECDRDQSLYVRNFVNTNYGNAWLYTMEGRMAERLVSVIRSGDWEDRDEY